MAENDENIIAFAMKYDRDHAGGLATNKGHDIQPDAVKPREAKMTPGKQEEFYTGPLRILTDSVENNTQVLINCRNNNEHLNMVLEEVKEIWTELPMIGKGREQARPVHEDRFIPKMFLRGDSARPVHHDGLGDLDQSGRPRDQQHDDRARGHRNRPVGQARQGGVSLLHSYHSRTRARIGTQRRSGSKTKSA